MRRCKCTECGRVIPTSKMLIAPHPFDSDDIVSGCPHCQSIEKFVLLCDVHGCSEIASCGWPSEDGYRATCYNHKDYKEKK